MKTTMLAIMFPAALALTAGCGDDGDGSGGGLNCANRGPGETPLAGSGTLTDPFIIVVGTSYGGCAGAQVDPGPLYGVEVSAGTYTITQSNGVTDLELWIYTDTGDFIGTIDDVIGGFDESGTETVPAGRYGIEVYNNGAVEGIGRQDGPFTLTVTGG